MDNGSRASRVLLVGNSASISRTGFTVGEECEVDLVESLAEAIERQASGDYGRVIVDAVALQGSAFEILANPASPRRINDDPAVDYTLLRRSSHYTEVPDAITGIIESLRDSIFCLDRDWRFTWVNKEAERQFRKSREELIGHSVWELFPQAIGTDYWDHYHKSMNEREPTSSESYYPPHDIWTEVRVFPADEGIAVYCLDITEHRKSTEALAAEHAMMQATLDAMPLGVAIADAQGRIIKTNGQIVNIWGGTTQPAHSIEDYGEYKGWWPDTGEQLRAEDWAMSRALSKGEFIVGEEVNIRRLDGSHATILNNAAPIRDAEGHIIGGIVIQQDITERKRTEESLRESEDRFRTMADGLPLIVWVHDANGNQQFVNSTFCEYFGVTIEEMRDDRWQILMHPDSGPAYVEEFFACARDRAPFHAQVQVVNAAGEWRWLESWGRPRLSPSGEFLGFVGTSADITERKLVEQLQHEVLEREHHIAEVLQRAIIPPDVPSDILGYQVAVKYRPALREAEIGGDFYDVFEVGDNKLGVLIGDVAGKGLPAALRVASARYAIRSYAYLDPRPARVLKLANDALCAESEDMSQILTAFFAVLDPEAGVFTYASAGHEPPIVRCVSGECDELAASGLPLGLTPGVVYDQASRRLDPGDVVVMVTDGITEARSFGAELYGQERLMQFIRERTLESPGEIAEGLMQQATAHADGELQDDAAIVVISPHSRKVGR